MQVPQKTLEPMLHNGRRFRWTPNAIWFGEAIECSAKKGVKPCHVIHVQVGKKQVVYGQNITRTEDADAPFSAIEEQALHSLPAIDLQKDCVIAACAPQNARLNAHGASTK